LTKRYYIAGACVALVCIAAAAIWWFAGGPSASKLVSLKNTGVGYLENGLPVEAAGQFSELHEKAPGLKLPVRNLAVAHIMRYKQIDGNLDPTGSKAAYDAGQLAVANFIAAEPDSADGYILASRLESSAGQTAKALDYLKQARQRRPDDAAIWFDTYMNARLLDTAESKQTARQALSEASRLAPANTFVLLDWMLEQAVASDPQIAKTLDNAQKLLSSLEADVQLRVRVSLAEMLSKAAEAARSGDWSTTRRNVRMVVNVTRPAPSVQSDLLEVDLHELEFAQIDFPDDFYTSNRLSRAVASQPIRVAFTPASAAGALSLAGITDIAAVDYDLDGALEIAVVAPQKFVIFDRENASAAWKIASQTPLQPGFTKVLAADLDADAGAGEAGEPGAVEHTADIDFVVYGTAGITILENKLTEGKRSMAAVEQPAKIQQLNPVNAATLCDVDHDGDLDIIVAATAPVVLSNIDGLHFSKLASDAVQGGELLADISSVTAVDWDRDIDSDIVVTGKGVSLLENLRHGHLRAADFAAGAPLLAESKQVLILDADSNASWDLLSLSDSGLSVALSRTIQPGQVTWIREAVVDVEGIDETSIQRMQLTDYDNDGLEDILAWNSEGAFFLRNLGDAVFGAGPELPDSVGVIQTRPADIDADGDLDLLVVQADGLRVFINEGGNTNAWTDVTLLAAQVKGEEASSSGRVNQYGIGSLVEIRAGAFYQARTVREPVTHIGLGQRTSPDLLRFTWTNGIPDNHLAPKTKVLVYERQSLKGSCPYLYTWNGERFVFATDLLWASPIGLVSAEGKLVPARPWEWLKVSGDLLKPADNEYKLQITEELWEAAYFDQVELFAVDHPAEVEIFTNEKVGPPFMATPMIHKVRDAIKPVSAVDSSGRNILPQLSAIDDRYARPFSRKLMQGYTQPHYMELDFGDAVKTAGNDGGKITLFLTGWVYPTDTSINKQLSDNPAMAPPRPPHLLTPDADGAWKEVNGFIGFPGGKTKTIAVDVSSAFSGNDYRLRIATSMELYWDAAFLTAGPQTGDVVQQPAPMIAADLHFRGVSQLVQHPGFGPQRYDYGKVQTSIAWPPMQGGFTRYGDVLELVNNEDDRVVILGSGDEMTLTFAMPQQPCPPGWKRDFVLHNIGYDKDADLNTVYGQTVLPMPFRGMKGYPYVEDPPEVLQRDLVRFHTRKQNQFSFRNALRLAP